MGGWPSRPHMCAAASLVFGTVLLAGCGNEARRSTDIAARVNSVDIHTEDVSRALVAVSASGDDARPVTRQKVLNNLIDQALAVDAAQKLRLDRTTSVRAAIDEARKEAIARAYFQSVAAAQPQPSDTEVHAYYIDHPELFAQRRIYTLNEISIDASPQTADELNAMAISGSSYAQIVSWLQSHGVKFEIHATSKAAEALPLQFLPRLARLADGRVLVMADDSGLTAAQVVSSNLAPISETVARPSIRRFLINQSDKQAVEAEVFRLRAAAKISYGQDAASAGAIPAEDDPAHRELSAKASLSQGASMQAEPSNPGIASKAFAQK